MNVEKVLYGPLDAYIKRLKRKIKEGYAGLYVSGFDQLNIIQLSKTTEALYSGLDEFNRDEYIVLAKHAKDTAVTLMGKQAPAFSIADYIEDYLGGYDPVSQYVYEKEVDRKRMRLNESILTAKEYADVEKLHKAVKKAADLWFTQSSQYALDIMLGALIETYRRSGVKKLRWNTVIDGHECVDCRELDGKVFPIDSYPAPQHYGCRCFPTPVWE